MTTRRRLARALAWTAALAAAAALAAFLAGRAGLLDRLFVYFPEREVASSPGEHGLGYEDVWIESGGGARIHGWLVRPPDDAGRRAVLWLHGNSGNIGHRAAAVSALARALRAPVLIIDYRGYGLSEGSPGEEGLYADAEAAFDHLAARPELAGRDLVIFGRSLGSAVAVRLATRRDAEALIIESPFTSVSEMARLRHRLLPVSLLVRSRFDTLALMPSVRMPVLVLHGTDDEIVPLSMGRRIHAAAGRGRMVELEGASHNEPHHDPAAPYFDALREFLGEVGGGRP